jgi:hypothetical protein
MRAALRSFALTLAISAMALRALLPAGWMPAGDLHAPVMICPGMSGTHGPLPHHGVPQHAQACPFAALAHLAAPAVTVPIPLPREQSVPRNVSFVAFVISVRTYRPQSPRAPPVSA